MTDVGILGATGVVGQHFVALLDRHPWFRVTWLAASERSAGKLYGELPWRLARPQPRDAAALRVVALEDAVAAPGPEIPPLLFSALDASVAGEAETAFAKSGRLVVSNARNHRMDPLVPLLIPEVNPDHLGLLGPQRAARGWTGGIVTNPNCSTIVIAMALARLRPVRAATRDEHDAPGALRRRAIRASPRSTRWATSSRTSAAAKRKDQRPRR
jgi:aspartate-semialdehyde dehydrogenase